MHVADIPAWPRTKRRRRRWHQIRPASLCAGSGAFLTLLTVVLGISNIVSAQQAVAIGMPAVAVAFGGWIGLIAPGALVAWRRGFAEGYRTAMRCQPSGGDSAEVEQAASGSLTSRAAREAATGQLREPRDRWLA
jgi:hypothetical protein